MSLEDLTNAELKQQLTDAGLATYGTKEQMIERLNKNATAELTGADVVVEEPEAVPETAPLPVMPKEVRTHRDQPTIILSATPQQMQIIAPVNPITNGELDETVNWIRNNYQGLTIRYLPEQEIVQFEGGPQGRYTTTSRQPAMAIKAAARTYVNEAGLAMQMKGELGALGEV